MTQPQVIESAHCGLNVVIASLGIGDTLTVVPTQESINLGTGGRPNDHLSREDDGVGPRPRLGATEDDVALDGDGARLANRGVACIWHWWWWREGGDWSDVARMGA